MRLRDLIYEHERVPMSQAEDPLGGSDEPILLEDPAPGTDGAGGEPVVVPPAEAQTTEPTATPPSTVPYSRFQEVNEARKAAELARAPLDDFEQLGYPVEDLQRLVQWETEFAARPGEAWISTAKTILDDLPEGVREAVLAHTGEAAPAPTSETPPPPESPADADAPPAWAQELIEDKRKREEREAEAARTREAEQEKARADATLTEMVEAWKKLDEADEVVTSESTILTYLMDASRRVETAAQAVALGRSERLAAREADLAGVIQPRPGLRTVPRSGSAALRTEPARPRTLAEATKLSQAQWGQQELQPD